MKREDLFEAIGETDPELVADCRRRIIPWKQLTAAAAACLALVVTVRLWQAPPKEPNTQSIPAAVGTADSQSQAPDSADCYPEIPAIEFKTPEAAQQTAYDIALPEGHFFHDMTPAEIGSMFCVEQLDSLGEHPITGRIIYDGNGDPWSVSLYEEGNNAFQAEFSLGHLPLECVVVEEKGFTVDYNGIELTALQIGDWYEISALHEGLEAVGFRARCQNKAPLEALAYLISSHDLQLSQLHVDDVPEWRSERMDEASARAEEGFTEYLPTVVPDRFTFDMAYRELGQGRNHLTMDYFSDGIYGYLEIMAQKVHTDFPIIDPTRPETYDRSDYSHGGEVPEEYWDTYELGVFRAEDLTPERVAARCCVDPEGYKTCELRVLYPDDTMVWITGGITAQEAWELVSQIG